MAPSWKFIVFGVVFCVSGACIGEKDVGDSCAVAGTGLDGSCKLLENCPAVISEIIHGALRPTTCGFIGNKQVVCCPYPIASTPSHVTEASVLTRISQKKCVEYGRQLKNSDDFHQCHVGSNGPITFVGDVAALKEFPHMARLGLDNKDGGIFWACGGSLISDEFVLSAAHCLNTREYGSVKYVSLGEHHNDDEAAHRIQVGVSEIIVHPNFRRQYKYNDIGLIRLDRKVNFNIFVRPACLADQFQPSSNRAIATGWQSHFGEQNITNILIKPTVEIYSQEECNATYSKIINRTLKDGIIEESQLCAGPRNGISEICQGSTGAPLLIFHPREECMHEVLGVTSFGSSCFMKDSSDVYTRVFHYLDWIEQNVWPNDA